MSSNVFNDRTSLVIKMHVCKFLAEDLEEVNPGPGIEAAARFSAIPPMMLTRKWKYRNINSPNNLTLWLPDSILLIILISFQDPTLPTLGAMRAVCKGFKLLLDSERETDAAREREARAVAEVASLRDELQRNASAAETVQEDLQRQVDVAEAEVTELRRQLDTGRSTLRRVCAERTQTFESALSDVSRLSRAAASATAEDSPSSPPSPQPRQPAEEVPAASLEAIPPRNVRGLPQSESSVELAAVAGIVAAAVRQTLPLPVMMPTPPQERPSSRFVPRRYVPRPPSGPYLGRARQSSRELRPYPQPSQQVVEPPASRPASQPLAHSETSSTDSNQLESHPRSRNRPDEDTPCGPVRRAMSRASVGGSAAAGGASGKAEGEADVEAAGSEAGGNAWPGGAPWAPWPAARPIGTPTTPSYGRRAPKASYP